MHKTAASANGDLTLVVPKGDMRAAFAELTGIDLDKGLGLLLTKKDAKTEVRCGVASFHADHGDLKATTLLVDTTHLLVTGGGDINRPGGRRGRTRNVADAARRRTGLRRWRTRQGRQLRSAHWPGRAGEEFAASPSIIVIHSRKQARSRRRGPDAGYYYSYPVVRA